MALQLYGLWDDYGSFANVSRGMAYTMRQKYIPFSVWNVNAFQPKYLAVPWKIAHNPRADVGVYVGYPPNALGWLVGHSHKVLMTVCETTKIPSEWVDIIHKVDRVVVPSRFCRQTLLDSGVRTPITVAAHGVDPRLLAARRPARKPDGTIRLLHVSGAVSFPQRKGTPQLLGAMHKIQKDFPNVHLTLRTARTQPLEERIHGLGLEGTVSIDEGESLDPGDMGRYLATFDGVVQPSRGEGFGLLPLEARSVGVPVVATRVTGHMDHYAIGVDVEVPTRAYTMMSTQGNEVGAAPGLLAADVEHGLREFLRDPTVHRLRAQAWANRFAEGWLWSRQLSAFVRSLESQARRRNRSMRFGDSSGLRGV